MKIKLLSLEIICQIELLFFTNGQNQKQAHTKSYQLCMCLNPFFVIRSDIFFNLMENNQGKHFHLN